MQVQVQMQVQLPPQGVTTTFTRSDKLRKNEALAVVRHFAEQFGINLASPHKRGQTMTMTMTLAEGCHIFLCAMNSATPGCNLRLQLDCSVKL